MAKTPLTRDSQFVVGEEKVLNYVMAALLFALFLYGVLDAVNRNFKNIDYQSYVFALAILPAIFCYRRANNKRVYIRVNKKGIYQDEKLVTDWSNFRHAFITQKEKSYMVSTQDNFILVIQYRKEGVKQVLRRDVPLTNTQNKSEEDVLDAVNFFWKEYKKGDFTQSS